MTGRSRDVDALLGAYFEDGPTEAPDRAIEAAVELLGRTRQERRRWQPWRFEMSNRMRLGTVAAAAIVVVVAGIAILGRPQMPPVASSPSPSAVLPGTPVPSTALPTGGPSPSALATSPNIGLATKALNRLTTAIGAAQAAVIVSADEAGRLQAAVDGARLSLGDGSLELALVGWRAFTDQMSTLEPRLTGHLGRSSADADMLLDAVTAADVALNAKPLGTGTLPSGPYRSTYFVSPLLAFALPDGWSSFVDDADVLAFKHGNVVLAFNHTATAATADAMATAIGHHGTAAFTAGPTAVSYGSFAGFTGQAEPRATLWYTAGLQGFDAAPGDVVRIWVLTVEGRVLTIEMTGPSAEVNSVLAEFPHGLPGVGSMLRTFVAYQAPG